MAYPAAIVEKVRRGYHALLWTQKQAAKRTAVAGT